MLYENDWRHWASFAIAFTVTSSTETRRVVWRHIVTSDVMGVSSSLRSVKTLSLSLSSTAEECKGSCSSRRQQTTTSAEDKSCHSDERNLNNAHNRYKLRSTVTTGWWQPTHSMTHPFTLSFASSSIRSSIDSNKLLNFIWIYISRLVIITGVYSYIFITV